MRKNSKTWLLFFIVFVFLATFISTQTSKIDTDFFSIIQNKEVKSNKEIFKQLNQQLNKEIVFLIKDENISDKVIKRLNNSHLFSKVTYGANKSLKQFFKDLNFAKLALIDRETLKTLKNDPKPFFEENAKAFFSPISERILSPSKDFFNFSKKGLKNSSNVYLNPKDGRLHVKDGPYFFINATLKNGYNSSTLLNLIYEIKALSSDMLISGGAIYSALGKKTGESQSLYMSVASLGLSAFLLLFVFRRFSILSLGLVAVFGLSLGLAFTFLFFDSVHIISIILSSSLIGLMYDFTIHWLSFNTKTSTILPIKNMLKIFLIGLFITISGYAIFLFAPLNILRETAIFSIFALIGAFFCTYFLLPTIFRDKHIQAYIKVVEFINIYKDFMQKITLSLHVKGKTAFFVLFLGILAYTFTNLNFTDSIKSYASTPKVWLDQANKISQLTGVKPQTKLLVLKDDNELDLVKTLKDRDLISGYNGVSKYLLTKREQNEVKNLFKKYANDENITSIYTDLGFDKALVVKAFKDVANQKTLSPKDVAKLETFATLKNFLANDNKRIVYLSGVKNSKEVAKIAKQNGASFNDFIGSLNSSFQHLKNIALWLKLIAYVVAFLFLAIFYGFKKSFLMISLVIIPTFLTLFVLTIFGYYINIFSVFGLILSSAIGIDYMIFALNQKLQTTQKLFGIVLASFTTMISFSILATSSTEAVSVFGLSVSVSVLFCAIFASGLAVVVDKNCCM